MIGQRIKHAVEKSTYTPDQIAAHAEMSTANLYRIYKRDSIETRYLKKISEILNLPYTYFLDEEPGDIVMNPKGDMVQQAARVGSNNQSISVGGMSKEECEEKLADLQEKYDLAKKSLADKEMIIEMLKGKKSE